MYEPYEVGIYIRIGITLICAMAMKMNESSLLQFLCSMLGHSYCPNFLSKENVFRHTLTVPMFILFIHDSNPLLSNSPPSLLLSSLS